MLAFTEPTDCSKSNRGKHFSALLSSTSRHTSRRIPNEAPRIDGGAAGQVEGGRHLWCDKKS